MAGLVPPSLFRWRRHGDGNERFPRPRARLCGCRIPVVRCDYPRQYGSRWGRSCSKREQCERPAKHPVAKGWQSSATTDTDTTKEWWSEGGCHNIGMITGAPSGIVVLDIDPHHGGDDT